MRKICVVTGSRAEFGLLFWVMKAIESDPELELQIIATGMHLSYEFGETFREIEKDFKLNKKIEILLSSDTPIGVSKSMGLAQISFAEAYSELNPDIVVVLGDRFEIFSAACAAMISRIPIAHIHGGEKTEGAVDEAIRHSITKLSHLHFVANEEYRRRVVQLGENPATVFNFGTPGLDSIHELKLLPKEVLEKDLDFKFGDKSLLITFHPVTLEVNSGKKQLQELLKALDELSNTNLLFTKANADTGGREINQLIDDYVARNPSKAKAFTSLGQLKYLSAMQYVDGVVGNSSSGLIEAPTLGIGVINIGDRQRGRRKAASIIDCIPEMDAIKSALSKLFSREYKHLSRSIENPYGNGKASKKIVSKLKSFPIKDLLKKNFFDIAGNF